VNVITKIDSWLGRTLFLPPIIKLCQWTRQTQFAVSRLFWFIAALDGFWRADTLFASIMFGLLSVFMMVTASLRADMPATSTMGFRMLAILFLLMDVAKGLMENDWAGTEFWIFVLIAEYAASIRTIPPTEASERSRRASEARGQ
jgi:hypothetical protein